MTFKNFSKIPLTPGVYIMKDHAGNILYIGKANSLQKRVKQYFSKGRKEREMVPYLTSKVADIETIILPDEREALLLENTLIKKHKPPYNILLKDDKTFISITITTKKQWPMAQIVRIKGRPQKNSLHFGPFTSAYSARQTLALIQKIFPLRQCSDRELQSRKRPCLLYGIKRCIAPCVGKCTQEEYNAHVANVIAFLRGNDTSILDSLYRDMEKASRDLAFERAGELLHTIRQIEKTISSKKSLMHSLKKDTDVFGIYRLGEEFSIVKLSFREGRMTGSEPYSFHHIPSSEEAIWENFLLQHYNTLHRAPKEIVLPVQLNNASLLGEMLNTTIQTPQKGTKDKLIDMANTNAQAAFQEEAQEKVLLNLRETLHLPRAPLHIECFDISHTSGSSPVGAAISYIDGKYDRSKTRYFTLKEESGDDYAAMEEALWRHYTRAKQSDTLPDLLMLDGGKGQRNRAMSLLQNLEIASVDVIALAKDESLHTKGLTGEKVYVAHKKEPILLPHYSAELQLLQKIRDEAHRVVIGLHKKKRSKKTVQSSLRSLPGIGPKKQRALLTHFGSVQQIKQASEEALAECPGLTKRDRATLREFQEGSS